MTQEKIRIAPHRAWFWAIAFFGVVLAAGFIMSSRTSSTINTNGTSSGMGTVNVMVSDPATCSGPGGAFSHVYVTIVDIQANISSMAGSSDNGWVDVTPNLAKAPVQVDLLGQANSQCFLATLGNTQLQAGTYQQLRLILAPNSGTVYGTNCGTANNCVMLTSDAKQTPHPLLLSSEAQTGIKIPGSQIASGGLTIAPGKTADLDIDFMTCESIVQEGNGQFRLKPVLHAGEVSTNSTSISGTVVDSAAGKAISGKVVVAVEQKDSTGVYRVQMSTLANADGTFVFCPLASGTYDVVVVGTATGGALYQPSIITGVTVGSTTGTIDLHLPTTTTTPTLANSAASIGGQVTSQNSANPPAGTVADVQLSALETVNGNTYTIPLPPTSTQMSDTLGVETAAAVAPATCPPGTGTPAGTTDCVAYTLNVPSGGAYYAAWSASGAALTAPAGLAAYSVDGIASSGGSPDCSPGEIMNPATPAALTGAGPYAVTGLNLAFKACQ